MEAEKYEEAVRDCEKVCKMDRSRGEEAKTMVLSCDRSIGGRLRLGDRNFMLMKQFNVYIINPVVMGFQKYICLILCFSWSSMVKFCVLLRMSSSMLPLEKNIFHEY